MSVAVYIYGSIACYLHFHRLISVDPTKKDLEDFTKLVEEGEPRRR